MPVSFSSLNPLWLIDEGRFNRLAKYIQENPGANKCFPAECKIPLRGVESMPFPMVLVLALRLPQSVPSAPTRDAPSVLNAVSQRYADARSYHFEAVEEQTSSNELSRHWG